MKIRSLMRPLFLLAFLAVTACSGAGVEPTQPPLNPATIQLWTTWASRAQEIASGTEERYRSPTGVPLNQAAEQQRRAQALAVEIRSEESSNQLVTRLADDLEELVEALGFAMEFADNAGHPALIVELPSLSDALTQMSNDAAELMEAASR